MIRILTLIFLLSGCATARDSLLPRTGDLLQHAHAAQNSLVDARAELKVAEALLCSNPDPVVAPVCSKVDATLQQSKTLLNFSADGLDIASGIYTDLNGAVSK